jgi:hypothetical protein
MGLGSVLIVKKGPDEGSWKNEDDIDLDWEVNLGGPIGWRHLNPRYTCTTSSRIILLLLVC